MDGITSWVNDLLKNVPDVILALLVLILAFFCAWVAKKATLKLIKLTGLERLLAKAGMNETNRDKTKAFVARLIQLIVFILFMPGVFEKLGLNNVASPIMAMTNQFTTFVPTLIAALVLLMVGIFVAKQLGALLEQVLITVGLDKGTNKLLEVTGTKTTGKFSLSKLVAEIVHYAIDVFVLIEVFNMMHFDILVNIGHSIVKYSPMALSAVLIFCISVLAANYVSKNVIEKFSDSKTIALILKSVIVTVGVFIMLSQLGVARDLVNSAFVIILGALGVAFAVAFGIGGREFAAHTMRKLEGKIDERSKKARK